MKIKAEPYEFEFDPKTTALISIDFQRDFVYRGGFGELLGNDTSRLAVAIPLAATVLRACRETGIFIVHTREGHRPDLADLPEAKRKRGNLKIGIGDVGPMGRILIRGKYGHDIVDELQPIAGEPVVDKPGKGSFYATDLDAILKNRGIRQLVAMGVTTEVCVQATVREANDRGYDALVLSDCVASYSPEFQRAALEMIKAQRGIFGWVTESKHFLDAIARRKREENVTPAIA
jgi:biuret amidohydrolase